MLNRYRPMRVLMLLGLVTTCGMLFAGSGLGCASMAFDQAATAVDFCFLFDCQSGAFGGLVQFCDPLSVQDTEGGGSLLADCVPTTGTTP
ncbi:MAG: hypothetical protein GY842_18705 [bacterium]|nr:hypothetical protein [bacterium]